MARLTSLEDELAAEERTLRVEQEWFLNTQVKPNLQAIQKALQACQDAAQLQDNALGALTLAISSPNADTLKGFVTLAGSFIVKGDLTIKLPKLPIVKVAIHSHVPNNATAPTSSSSAAVSTAASTAVSIAATSSSASSIKAGGAVGNADGGAEETASSHVERTGGPNDDSSQQAAATASVGGPSQVLHEALGALPLSISTTASGTTSGTASGTVTPPTGGSSSSSSGALAVLAVASGSLLAPTTAPLPPPTNVNTHQLLHSYRPPGHLTQPYLMEQIKDVQNHTAQAIFRLEDYWSSGCGDTILQKSEEKEEKPHSHAADALELDIKASLRPLKTLLELMQRHLRAGIEAMARPKKEKLYPFRVCDPKIFSPALSEDFVIEFYIRDSQLVCAAYALQLTGGNNNNGSGLGGNSITSYLQQAMPGAPSQTALSTSTTSGSFSDGHHHALTHSPQQHSLQVGASGGHGGEQGTKSGQATPRPSSPAMYHHMTSSQTNHQQPQQQQSQVSGAKAYPWSPSRSPPTPQQPHHPGAEYHSSASVVSSPPPNESIVLPSSSKIGQTSKGGINKYRGKVATTIEDKVVQVESPKLTEISTRLAHAEGLCRRLLQFLVLQESCGHGK